MAVLPISGWKARLDQLKPTLLPPGGEQDFVDAIGDLTDPLIATGGSAPIQTFGRPAMFAALQGLHITFGSEWAQIIAAAWFSGMSTAVVHPGTVTDASWTGSATLDTQTSAIGASAFTNLAAAQAQLQAALLTATTEANSTLAFATAFHDATLTLKITCIGLGPPPVFVPIPIIKGVA